jgi:hypothetical protein
LSVSSPSVQRAPEIATSAERSVCDTAVALVLVTPVVAANVSVAPDCRSVPVAEASVIAALAVHDWLPVVTYEFPPSETLAALAVNA